MNASNNDDLPLADEKYENPNFLPGSIHTTVARFKRDSSMRFSTSGFFHESVSPEPLSIQLAPFQILLKILGDIRNSRSTTGGKWKKSSIRKVLII
jgi:hypothetical protein